MLNFFTGSLNIEWYLYHPHYYILHTHIHTFIHYFYMYPLYMYVCGTGVQAWNSLAKWISWLSGKKWLFYERSPQNITNPWNTFYGCHLPSLCSILGHIRAVKMIHFSVFIDKDRREKKFQFFSFLSHVQINIHGHQTKYQVPSTRTPILPVHASHWACGTGCRALLMMVV